MEIRIESSIFSNILIFMFFCLLAINFAQASNPLPNNGNSQNKSLSDFDVEYLAESHGISILNFTGNYDRVINASANFAARKAVLQKLYQNQPDQYDLIYIFTEFEFDTGPASAFATSIMNDVAGIGKPIFDNRTDYFSEKVQTIIDMAYTGRWNFNPANIKFDTLLDTMIHETMHRWGIAVKYMDSNNLVSDRLLGAGSSHWSYFLNSNASVMYGSNWQEISSNLFKTSDTRHGLSPLDLYLAGFISKDAVADTFLISNANSGVNTDFPPPIGTEITGDKEIISINDIIAYEGARAPNFANSQHEFKVKFILLKRVESEISSQSVASLYILQNEFQKRFFAETNGIGQIILPSNQNNLAAGNPNILDFNPQLNLTFDVAAAIDFLLLDETVDFWQDRTLSRVRDTVTTIKSLQLVVDNFPAIQNKLSRAILWLNSYQPQNNDEIAWMLSSGVLTNEKKQLLIDTINANQYPSGGWGLNSQVNASPYDTALVIDGLTESLAGDLDLNIPTTQFVLDNINQDSGFSFVVGGESSLITSSLLLKSIAKISTDPQHLTDLTAFLLGKKLPDNSYGGNGVGTPHETALVIMALASLNASANQTQLNLAKAALDKMQSIDGSMQGSIYATALAINVFNGTTKANLHFNEVSVTNNSVIAGEQITLNFAVQNSGVHAATNIEITVFKDAIAVNNQVTQMLIDLLAANQTQTDNLLIDTSGFNLNTELIVVIDTNNTINESNEDDNVYTLTLLAQQPSTTPELAFDVGAFTLNPTQFELLPFTVNTSATVTNLSLVNIDDVIVTLAKIEPNGQHILLATQSLNIAAQGSQEFIFSAEITQANVDISLVFKIDPENLIAEVNEDNNSHIQTITKVQSVDLAITSQDISLPSQAVFGETQNISFTFVNSGTEFTSSFEVNVYAEINSNSQLIFTSQISELAAGAQLSREFTWIPQTVGNYNLSFILDEANQLAETNETNNAIIVPLQVVANALSNLSIEAFDVSISPDPGLQGQNLQFSLHIHNNSTIDSGIFDITIYQQMPTGIPSLVIASSLNNASIIANSSTIMQLDIPNTNLIGNQTYIFAIDSSNAISEFNENDNIVIKDFIVLSKPDAYISTGSFQLTPSTPVVGSQLSVAVSVENIGEQDLSQLDVALYYDNSQLSSPTIATATQTIALLAGGQSQLTTFTFNYPNDENIDALILRLDEQNTIDEGSESNNQASIVAGNQDASLYVTQRYFSPNSDGIKDQTSIVFNVDTAANYQLKIIDSDFKLIKSFAVSLFTNTAFGDVLWDGKNNYGVLARDGDYQVQLLDNNSIIVASTTVTLDTNKSSLFKSFAENNGYTTDLNCIANFTYSRFKYSHDGKNLYTTSYTDFSNQQQRGLFKIKADGSKLTSELSQQFLTGVNLNDDDYRILENGNILISFSQAGLDKLYLKEVATDSLVLLDSTAVTSRIFAYTSTFVIMDSNTVTGRKLTKVYYDTSIANQEIQFQNNIYI